MAGQQGMGANFSPREDGHNPLERSTLPDTGARGWLLVSDMYRALQKLQAKEALCKKAIDGGQIHWYKDSGAVLAQVLQEAIPLRITPAKGAEIQRSKLLEQNSDYLKLDFTIPVSEDRNYFIRWHTSVSDTSADIKDNADKSAEHIGFSDPDFNRFLPSFVLELKQKEGKKDKSYIVLNTDQGYDAGTFFELHERLVRQIEDYSPPADLHDTVRHPKDGIFLDLLRGFAGQGVAQDALAGEVGLVSRDLKQALQNWNFGRDVRDPKLGEIYKSASELLLPASHWPFAPSPGFVALLQEVESDRSKGGNYQPGRATKQLLDSIRKQLDTNGLVDVKKVVETWVRERVKVAEQEDFLRSSQFCEVLVAYDRVLAAELFFSTALSPDAYLTGKKIKNIVNATKLLFAHLYPEGDKRRPKNTDFSPEMGSSYAKRLSAALVDSASKPKLFVALHYEALYHLKKRATEFSTQAPADNDLVVLIDEELGKFPKKVGVTPWAAGALAIVTGLASMLRSCERDFSAEYSLDKEVLNDHLEKDKSIQQAKFESKVKELEGKQKELSNTYKAMQQVQTTVNAHRVRETGRAIQASWEKNGIQNGPVMLGHGGLACFRNGYSELEKQKLPDSYRQHEEFYKVNSGFVEGVHHIHLEQLDLLFFDAQIELPESLGYELSPAELLRNPTQVERILGRKVSDAVSIDERLECLDTLLAKAEMELQLHKQHGAIVQQRANDAPILLGDLANRDKELRGLYDAKLAKEHSDREARERTEREARERREREEREQKNRRPNGREPGDGPRGGNR